MKWLITVTARLVRAVQRAYLRKWSFFGLSAFVFVANVAALAYFDLLPSAIAAQELIDRSAAVANAVAPAQPELPTKIRIPAIELAATIANPTHTDAALLDTELLKGAVRYPTSARLGEMGNVVVFGHSSYLPIVGNQAYKTFNGIQKLKVNDVIIVSSLNMEYTYVVRTVTKESANDAVIPLAVAGRVLTLSTCNSFAEKSDRFVVVADFVESHAIPL